MRKKSFKPEVFAEMRRADGTRELIFNASLNSVFGRAGRSAADRALPTGRGLPRGHGGLVCVRRPRTFLVVCVFDEEKRARGSRAAGAADSWLGRIFPDSCCCWRTSVFPSSETHGFALPGPFTNTLGFYRLLETPHETPP